LSIKIQHKEEFLSLSYISAVIAMSGYPIDVTTHDYGVDVSVRRVDSVEGKLMDMGVVFDCQLKATINWSLEESAIVYDLDAETYNKLTYRHQNNIYPCFLMVLCLPKEETDWLHLTEEELNIRKCCYYYYVNGEPTSNTRTVRIRIPREQIFSPETILKLCRDVRSGVYE
jgi:hypothetical protein